MRLRHLLRVHHGALAISSTSRHDSLQVLHLAGAHPSCLTMRSVDYLRGVHHSIRRNSLELRRHVLLLRWAERGMVLRPHVRLRILLPNVHRMCLVLGYARIALLFPSGTHLVLILHLLHRPVLRLPLGLRSLSTALGLFMVSASSSSVLLTTWLFVRHI